MAYWNGKVIVYTKPEPCKKHPGWKWVDCGCCGGIQWGGESPTTCSECDGAGSYFRHIKSSVYALYPGGPFLSREPK